MPEILPLDDLDLACARAASLLSSGALVVVPTDTLYGVVADAFNLQATQTLLDARGAGRDRPLPVLVRSPRQLPGVARDVGEQAQRLIAAFWPGPLTLVLPANESLAWDLGDSRGTVAVRMPDEDLVHALIAEVGPLACTAASPAGSPAPATAGEAAAALADHVALVLDGGPRPGGRSTIVDCSRGGAEVLRAGMVSADEVVRVVTGQVPWGNPSRLPSNAEGA